MGSSIRNPGSWNRWSSRVYFGAIRETRESKLLACKVEVIFWLHPVSSQVRACNASRAKVIAHEGPIFQLYADVHRGLGPERASAGNGALATRWVMPSYGSRQPATSLLGRPTKPAGQSSCLVGTNLNLQSVMNRQLSIGVRRYLA